MAKTLKLNVTFPMSIVVTSETLKEMQEARESAREVIASGKTLNRRTKYRIELMAGDKSDEQVLEQIYREGIRELLKKDFVKELQGDESRIRLGDIKVVFESPMLPKSSCEGCINAGCINNDAFYANAGCNERMVGSLAELSPRWTKTV